MADQLFLVRRMDLVLSFCIVFSAQLLLIFAFILCIQANDLTKRQTFIAWVALLVYSWTFFKQCLGFFRTFQSMVSESKISAQITDASRAECELLVIQTGVFVAAAAAIYAYSKSYEAMYFVYVLTALAAVVGFNAYLVSRFN